MSFSIPLHTLCREEYFVDKQYSARHIGSGDVEVLSTPAMILFMEITSLRCVEKYLPSEYTTVGTRVDVRHVNPAPVDQKITVEAEVVKVEDRRIEFRVKAFWRDILIGEGFHERYIVNRIKFIDKVRNLISQ